MIAFAKQLLVIGERYALHQNFDPIPWTRSDSDGFPYCISLAKPMLRGNKFEVIFTLSVLRTVESFRNPISKDIVSVLKLSTAKEQVVSSIVAFIPEWVRRLKLRLHLPEMTYHLTHKNGPNGSALRTSDKDVAGLMKDMKIFEAVKQVQVSLADTNPLNSEFTVAKEGINSKITQFPEKSGKTRTIAVIDYYSQRCLRPLHKGLMDVLRRLKSDGTYSHNNVGKFAQRCTSDKDYILCADLTAATDRFPKRIQEALLHELVKDKDLATALWTILADRTFTVAWSGEEVQYAAGQPMGAYASWPLFALSHHLVVEYCANKVKTNHISRKYKMIGDDVIIRDKRTGSEYLKVIQDLGLEINFNKTVVSDRKANYSSSEVAKQLYLNGTNLTPLTPGIITNLQSPHLFNEEVKGIIGRYDLQPETPAVLIELLYPLSKDKMRQQVLLNAYNPWNGSLKPFKEGVSGLPNPWKQVEEQMFFTTFYNVRRDILAAKAESLMMSVFSSEIPETYERGHPRPDGSPQLEAEYHSEMQLRCDLEKVLYSFNFDQQIMEEADSFLPVEYVVDPFNVYIDDRKQRRIHETTVVSETYNVLKMYNVITD